MWYFAIAESTALSDHPPDEDADERADQHRRDPEAARDRPDPLQTGHRHRAEQDAEDSSGDGATDAHGVGLREQLLGEALDHSRIVGSGRAHENMIGGEAPRL